MRIARSGAHQIGLVVNIEPKHLPADASDADRRAQVLADAYMNRQYLDPAIFGRYPEELPALFGASWPDWPLSEVEALAVPIDFLGLNYYTRSVVRHDPVAWPVPARSLRQSGAIYTETGWEAAPAEPDRDAALDARALRRSAAVRHGERRGLLRPALRHRRSERERVDDPLRVHYLQTHVARRPTRSRAAPTCAATARGRCSTTSSGHMAFPSASASCT